MELNSIKNCIKDKIEKAITLINELIENSTEIISIKYTQVNFNANGVLLDSKDLKNFIKLFQQLYEGQAAIFKQNFSVNNIIAEYFNQSLDTIKISLNQLSLKNDSIQYETFMTFDLGLTEEQQSELKQIISEDILNYQESQKKLFKEYKRRSSDILDLIIKYLNLLKSLFENIKNLSKVSDQGFTEFKNSPKYFLDENTINYGKKEIVNNFRKIIALINDINEILLTNVEIIDEEKKQRELAKLNNLNNSVKNKYKEICNTINDLRSKYNQSKKVFTYFDFGLKEINTIINDFNNLANQINEVNKIKRNKYEKIKKKEKENRVDVLLIVDTTSSMERYLEKFSSQFNTFIDNINMECPEAIIYFGFIGYKDLEDKRLGDEYIDKDFTANYEVIREIINKIEPDGGDDVPEDIAGAFELSLNKKWEGKAKIAILFTDSPCHGRKFHDLNQNQPDEKDKYLDGVPDLNIEESIKKFAEKKISLFCVNLHQNMNKMLKVFEDTYNKEKENDESEFYVAKDNIYDSTIINKITKLFNLKSNSRNEIIN
jgi:Mg-chelatase subunit ChlD